MARSKVLLWRREHSNVLRSRFYWGTAALSSNNASQFLLVVLWNEILFYVEVLGARVLLPCKQTVMPAKNLFFPFPHAAKFLTQAYRSLGLIFKQTITCAMLLLKAVSQKEQMLSQHLSCWLEECQGIEMYRQYQRCIEWIMCRDRYIEIRDV